MPPLHFVESNSAQPPGSGYSARISKSTWTSAQARIKSLFEQGYTRATIRDRLAREMNFHPSPGQLQAQMQLWNMGRYHTKVPIVGAAGPCLAAAEVQKETVPPKSSKAISQSEPVTSDVRINTHLSLLPPTDCSIDLTEVESKLNHARLLHARGYFHLAHEMFLQGLRAMTKQDTKVDSAAACIVEAVMACIMTATTKRQKQQCWQLLTPAILERLTMPQHYQTLFRLMDVAKPRTRLDSTLVKVSVDPFGHRYLRISPRFWQVFLNSADKPPSESGKIMGVTEIHLSLQTWVAGYITSYEKGIYTNFNPLDLTPSPALRLIPDPTEVLRRCCNHITQSPYVSSQLDSMLRCPTDLTKETLFQFLVYNCLQIEHGDGSDPACWATMTVELEGTKLYKIKGLETIAIIAKLLVEDSIDAGNFVDARCRWDQLLIDSPPSIMQYRFLQMQSEVMLAPLENTGNEDDSARPVLLGNNNSGATDASRGPEALSKSVTRLLMRPGSAPTLKNFNCCTEATPSLVSCIKMTGEDPLLTESLNLSNESFEYFAGQACNEIAADTGVQLSYYDDSLYKDLFATTEWDPAYIDEEPIMRTPHPATGNGHIFSMISAFEDLDIDRSSYGSIRNGTSPPKALMSAPKANKPPHRSSTALIRPPVKSHVTAKQAKGSTPGTGAQVNTRDVGGNFDHDRSQKVDCIFPRTVRNSLDPSELLIPSNRKSEREFGRPQKMLQSRGSARLDLITRAMVMSPSNEKTILRRSCHG